MSVRIRLMRIGKRRQPAYRIVAVQRKAKRTGGSLENLGHYSPVLPGKPLVVHQERVDYWLSKGAEVSASAQKLLKLSKHEPAKTEPGGAANP